MSQYKWLVFSNNWCIDLNLLKIHLTQFLRQSIYKIHIFTRKRLPTAKILLNRIELYSGPIATMFIWRKIPILQIILLLSSFGILSKIICHSSLKFIKLFVVSWFIDQNRCRWLSFLLVFNKISYTFAVNRLWLIFFQLKFSLNKWLFSLIFSFYCWMNV